MSTLYLIVPGALAVFGLVGYIVSTSEPAAEKRPPGYRSRHRMVERDVERPLPPARKLDEDQVVSFPVGHPELARPVRVEERTGEQPVVREVEHTGASEEWSPTAELAQVPARALDPDRVQQRRAEGRHRRLNRAVSPDRIADRHIAAAQSQLDEALAPLLQRIERAGHEDTDTWQWTAEEFAAIRARAGAQ